MKLLYLKTKVHTTDNFIFYAKPITVYTPDEL